MSSSSKQWEYNAEDSKWISPNGMWIITKEEDGEVAYTLTCFRKVAGITDLEEYYFGTFTSKDEFIGRYTSGEEIPKYVFRNFSSILLQHDKDKLEMPQEQEVAATAEIIPAEAPTKPVEHSELPEDIDPRMGKLYELSLKPEFNAAAPELPRTQKTEAEVAAQIEEIRKKQPIQVVTTIGAHIGLPVEEYEDIVIPEINENIYRISPFIAHVKRKDGTKDKAIVVGAFPLKPTPYSPHLYNAYHVINEETNVRETVSWEAIFFDYDDPRNIGRPNPERSCVVDGKPHLLDAIMDGSLNEEQFRGIKATHVNKKHLLRKLSPEAFATQLRDVLGNCKNDLEVTYEGQLKKIYIPELLRRFEDMLNSN